MWASSALIFAIQWVIVHIAGLALSAPWDAILPGLGIFGAAFLLSWGAELAQLEISQALALAFLALMAVLPEYAVDVYLAWTAAKQPEYTAFAAANMTGANRILIGFGWPAVLIFFWIKSRKTSIVLKDEQRIELITLVIATLYAFIIPLKRTLSLFDTCFLGGLFLFYIIQSAKSHHEEPELEGPPADFARLPRFWRRLVTVLLFIFPGVVIFIAAEPFAEGLLHGARKLGIEEFLLIQWLAPLASESPEFIVAVLFALRNNARAGLGTLISSKVNQWTLLIGMLPLAYSISGGHMMPMHLDMRQSEEIFLTAAQSLLAVVLLSNRVFGIGEALLLAVLFIVQLLVPITMVRIIFAICYVAISIGYLFEKQHRSSFINLIRNGFKPITTGK